MDAVLAAQLAAATIDPNIAAQLNADSKSLFDTVDDLRELGIRNFVDLPQIIVVGDQSSGKSSVLEAISRVRFPVDGNIGTRFATELVLRRAPGSETTSNVSIQFADQGHVARPPFKRTTFDKERLPDLIREATEAMGIRNGPRAKQFSKDILRIEVTGPGVPPITLVDLPGIFHSATADQDGEGREIVNQLIDSYMTQSKSIILAVVAADQQLAAQAVLAKAVAHDPKRERTIGVITKPDMAGRQNGRKYLDLAKGREAMHRLALGWYVLRNRSEEERASAAAARDAAEEAFFRSGDWSTIGPSNRGVESLRRRLSKVLLDHIRNSLPEVIVNIGRSLGDRKRELGQLGPSRLMFVEQRAYLCAIASKFHRLATDAVEGRYRDEFFGELNEREMRARKLRAVLGNMHLAFEVVMETKGARYKIHAVEGGNDGHNKDSLSHHPEHVQELVDGYDADHPEPKSVAKLSTDLEAAFNWGNGFSGDVNPDLVFLLLKKQTTPWEAIAQHHLGSVLRVTKRFVEQLFIYIIRQDEATLGALLTTYVDDFFDEKKAELDRKLAELLRPYVNGYALPREREARLRMRLATFERDKRQLETRLRRNYGDWFGEASDSGHFRVTIDQVVGAVCDQDRRERRTSEIEVVINKVTVQYEMFRETFIENVINLAVESCLVHHIPGILTTGKVDQMNITQLTELVSESEDIRVRRTNLEAEVIVLEEGLRMCERHRPKSLAKTGSNSTTASNNPSPDDDPAPSPAARNNPSPQPRSGATQATPTPAAQPTVPIPSDPITPSRASTTSRANNQTDASPTPAQRSLALPPTTSSTTSNNITATSPRPASASAFSAFVPPVQATPPDIVHFGPGATLGSGWGSGLFSTSSGPLFMGSPPAPQTTAGGNLFSLSREPSPSTVGGGAFGTPAGSSSSSSSGVGSGAFGGA
ncbi:P-loop containing nucleoside triphosphate hydrolase protein [Staphylotrichum tortipilum]|uniref:P-loop containing nucleoside triphosphate hydrolase protein n=1 Tax=Staphylotrichum tortipilum TaxID=2831512 RepID=A0AAN6RXD2_9PEZI|nr:P-loop containing nucleoside triphosphate hydrolase protein [Staphylotrichum longicolle]